MIPCQCATLTIVLHFSKVQNYRNITFLHSFFILSLVKHRTLTDLYLHEPIEKKISTESNAVQNVWHQNMDQVGVDTRQPSVGESVGHWGNVNINTTTDLFSKCNSEIKTISDRAPLPVVRRSQRREEIKTQSYNSLQRSFDFT